MKVIRAFKPILKDEEKEGREPYAVLTYGDTTIEIDYTIFGSLTFNSMHCSLEAKGALRDIYGQMAKDVTKSDKPTNQNFTHVFGRVYRVENQNGFNNALYASLGCAEVDGSALHYTKKELREAVQERPTSYPALVEFEDLMLSCGRIHVNIRYNMQDLGL